MWSVEVCQHSALGARRRNEDELGRGEQGSQLCLVLADGAGGHADGDLAARIAVTQCLDGFRARPPGDGSGIARIVLDAHAAVRSGQRARGGHDGARPMHATVVVLAIDTRLGSCLWGNVGDSRLYVVRDSVVQVLSRDDSVEQWLRDSGAGDRLPLVETPRGRLLAALGGEDDLVPNVSARPVPIRDGDVFLLCSDGWWAALDEGRLGMTPDPAQPLDRWIEGMAARIAARADPRQDNYSALACRLRAPADDPDELPTLPAGR